MLIAGERHVVLSRTNVIQLFHILKNKKTGKISTNVIKDIFHTRNERGEVIQTKEAVDNDQFVAGYLEQKYQNQEANVSVDHFLKIMQDIAGLTTLGTVIVDDADEPDYTTL